MSDVTEVAHAVRALTEFFSAYDLVVGEQELAGITVCGQLSLSDFKEELLEQPAVARMVQRFRVNPFDMENVFDLEDVLRRAVEEHRLFAPTQNTLTKARILPNSPISSLPDREGSFRTQVTSSPRPMRARGSGVEGVFTHLTRGDNNLQTQTRYLQWANQIFYPSCAELPEYELTASRPMLFNSILNVLNHVYAMQRVWQAHLLGKPHDFTSRRPAEDDVLGFTALREQQFELDAWYVEYADELPPEQHDEMVVFEFIDGGNGAMTRTEILQHVVNHASYHRGHIEGVFYQLGIEPPTTDMPVFLQLCDAGVER